MSRNQKVMLAILALVDVVVIAVLIGTVVRGMQQQPLQVMALPTLAARATSVEIPTWTPTPLSTPVPTLLPRQTRTPRPTRTPFPTSTPTPVPTPGPVVLVNPDFDMLMPNRIPGWQWDAFVNYRPGDNYDAHSSYAEPLFAASDDPVRNINGSTLKIETMRWVKFRAWVRQTVSVTAGSTVYFQVKANAFSSIEKLRLGAGVDLTGVDDCSRAKWGEVTINQDDGVVTITSPRVVVGQNGQVTVCLFAEPNYPDVNNAAFFDQAVLIAAPPRP